MKPKPVLLLLGLAGAMVVACGGPGSATPAPQQSVAITGDPIPLTMTAENIELKPATTNVPAGRVLDVTFENKDAGVPHDLVLKGGPDLGMELIKTEITTGPSTTELRIPGLVPGAYQFTCNVHPNMTASLTVGG